MAAQHGRSRPSRPPSRRKAWLSLLLLPPLAFVVSFLIGQAVAQETTTAVGQFDSSALTEALHKSGLTGMGEGENSIAIQFAKDGGEVSGEFDLELTNFPIGVILVGIGKAVGEGVAGAVAGVVGEELSTPTAAATPTPKERILLTCTSTLSLTGSLTGSYEAGAQHFTGQAVVQGSAYKDVRCSEPVPGLTDGPPQSNSSATTWEAALEGDTIDGMIAPAEADGTSLPFRARIVTAESESQGPVRRLRQRRARPPPSRRASPQARETKASSAIAGSLRELWNRAAGRRQSRTRRWPPPSSPRRHR